MRIRFSMPLAIFIIMVFSACQPSTETMESPSITSGFDSLKALEYGADDYGMRKYVVAFLKSGPNRDLSPEKAKELQVAHMKNIRAMADAGKLVLAGPFYDDGELRGLYFFDVENLEEAKALTNSDPAIQAGSLVMELKEWYGSAALMAVGDIHKNISKIKF